MFELSRDITPDPRTGEPLFKYTAFEGTNKVGSITLYGQDVVCRSEDGLSNNILEPKGIFEQRTVDTAQLADICRVLPPNEIELRAKTMTQSAALGALGGTTEVLKNALQKQGYSEKTSQNIGQFSYYFIYGLVRFMYHYQNYSNAAMPGDTQVALRAFMETVYEILFLIMVNGVCSGISQGANTVAQGVERAGWTNSAKTIGFFGRNVVYAKNIKEDGVVSAGLSFISGTAAQETTKFVGNKLLSWMSAAPSSKEPPYYQPTPQHEEVQKTARSGELFLPSSIQPRR